MPQKETIFNPLLKKYVKGFYYNIIFDDVTVWEEGKLIPDERFIPLLYNKENEIVSFLLGDENIVLIVFPQLEEKHNFICQLLNEVLSEVFPEKFLSLNSWLKAEAYYLPNEELLFKKRKLELQRHEDIITSIETEILRTHHEFGFLHELLTATGTPLVKAVIKYFKWIDFLNVVDVDSETGELNEDINIFTEDKLLLIEVKGINGTSTDDECSQINKHKQIKEKEFSHLVVTTLYVVNHQRKKPPHDRDNPPFRSKQIEYALNDKRGLLTTFQLFQWYKMCMNGILTKEEIRKQMFTYGLISILPDNYKMLGKIKRYFREHNAFRISIDQISIVVGESLVFKRNNEWIVSKVTSIKLNEENVNEVNSGEVGIVVEATVGIGFEVYKKIDTAL